MTGFRSIGTTASGAGGRACQVPCIERNAMGAVKAVNAASLALRGDGTHFVPLDTAVETMRQTGEDMLTVLSLPFCLTPCDIRFNHTLRKGP
jgi:L-serine deaminase